MVATETMACAEIPIHEGATLAPFFREAYGPAYGGDELLAIYLSRATKIITLQSSIGEVGAAGIVERSRLLMGAASPDRTRFGSRRAIAIRLFELCHTHGEAQWLTVGEAYPAAQQTVEQAGLERVFDREVARTFLSDVGREDSYLTVPTEEGVVLVNAVGPRIGYRQQLWAWEDACAVNAPADDLIV